MKLLHLLAGGNIGGIETLCRDYAGYSRHENVMIILWDDGPLSEEMAKQGVRVVCLHASKKNVFSVVRQVAELCRREKADALIAHHAAPMSHLCLLFIKKLNRHIRTVAYAHSNAVDIIGGAQKKRGAWLRKMILQASFNRADRVVAISKSVKTSLMDCFGTPEDKIAVIYNGVDLDRFDLPTKPAVDGTLRMIYVGRLIQQKGVQVLLQAMTCLPPDGKYHLKIVGDGPYRTELEAFVQEHNLTDAVEFLGSRRDIPELLSESDVFIHVPLLEEGFGITIVEAMAEGKICICARSGAIPEIITDGVDGFLVEKGNAEQLMNTILTVRRLAAHERIQIADCAKATAERFSIRTFAGRLDELVDSK